MHASAHNTRRPGVALAIVAAAAASLAGCATGPQLEAQWSDP